jgi:hypothetical protein
LLLLDFSAGEGDSATIAPDREKLAGMVDIEIFCVIDV